MPITRPITRPITCLADLADVAACPRLVVKVGSALLVDAGSARRGWLKKLVAELAAARGRGQQVIVVSSGAIALGAARLGLDKRGRGSLADAQAAAAVGQIALSGLWAELFSGHDIAAAQILLTLDDLEDRRRYLNATATLARLLDAGAIPVINENDSVATQEIRFGDNDRLAARVAQAAGASAVLLLSDIDGLYDRDPGAPGARLVGKVCGVTDQIHAMASGASGFGNRLGRHGVEAAGSRDRGIGRNRAGDRQWDARCADGPRHGAGNRGRYSCRRRSGAAARARRGWEGGCGSRAR